MFRNYIAHRNMDICCIFVLHFKVVTCLQFVRSGVALEMRKDRKCDRAAAGTKYNQRHNFSVEYLNKF